MYLLAGTALTLILVTGVRMDNERVTKPPSILVGPLSAYNIRDGILYYKQSTSSIVLPCRATGTPSPDYTWEKDGVLHDLTAVNATDKGSLKLTNPDRATEGYYQCKASNQHGTALSDVIQVRLAELTWVRFEQNEITLSEGDPASMPCEGGKSAPDATYTWYREKEDGSMTQVETTNNRFHINRQGTLFITAVTKDDATEIKELYRCEAANFRIDSNMMIGDTRLRVMDGTGQDVRPVILYVTGEGDPVVVLKGETMKLQCIFGGKPTPDITWTKDGSSLDMDVILTDFNTRVTVQDVTDGTAGQYTCRAGQVETHITVIVQEKPKFLSVSSRPRDLNVTEGGDAVFHCKTSADPPAKVLWMIDGKPLSKTDRQHTVDVTDGGLTFRAKSVCKTGCDTSLMVVQCNASNEHGYSFSSGYLNVLSPTFLDVTPESVEIPEQNLTSHEVIQFNCTASTDPSTVARISWVYEGRRVDPDSDPRFSVDPESGSLLVYPGDQDGGNIEGEYKCVANNSYSDDSATAMLTITRDGEVLAVTGLGDLWWVFLFIALLLLLIIFICCCCLCLYRNRGDTYPIEKIEKRQGNDPEKDVLTDSFQEYQRPELSPRKGSRASLGSSLPLDYDERGSMAESFATLGGTYSEDGSFRGEYIYDRKK